MKQLTSKQIMLKPQDLFVTLKIAVNSDWQYTYAELAGELVMSASEVHAAVGRAEMSRLLNRSDGMINVVKSALHEFLVHGVKYIFPPMIGGLTRGMPTTIFAPALKKYFMESDELPSVWPDPEGEVRGFSLQPLYHSVPMACRLDKKLYDLLTLVDALRSGAAREREIAETLLVEHMK
ncbi:hypothetical protein ACO0LL_21590 [Undibacterium sp. TC4M20W]|uniref:hypothetical protein n=1 Tax=Undibacterium sp. TC4M20W TaxID=3413052 RepID=UPI003BEFAF55